MAKSQEKLTFTHMHLADAFIKGIKQFVSIHSIYAKKWEKKNTEKRVKLTLNIMETKTFLEKI